MTNDSSLMNADPRSLSGYQGWQPIETAPKNGDHVLLAQDKWVEIGFWVDTSHQEQKLVSISGRRETYEWVDVVSGYWDGVTEIDGPTHWMPLPEPPEG